MDRIVVLDFGGQYAHLLANRVRRLGVYSEVKPNMTPAAELTKYKGIILSGGPRSVYEANAPMCDPKIFQLGVPVLGICYGHHLLAHILGGTVESIGNREYGLAKLEPLEQTGIFQDVLEEDEKTTTVWMSHGDSIKDLPAGFKEIGFSGNDPYTAVMDSARNFYGLQFHVEVTHTAKGMQMLDNFIDICRCKRDWKIEDYIGLKVARMKQQLGDKKVFMLMSGGVDSTVAFLLLKEALGEERIHGLFVDTGFLRQDEAKQVEAMLREQLGFKHLHVYDANKEFFAALTDAYDAEEKRKIIGQVFLDIKDKVTGQLKLDESEWLLGQGTIYPDTIESGGTQHADKIKTHHNRIDKIEEMIAKGQVIEPLKHLYKDEVRDVGKKFGLPLDMVNRHPFPGPGLAVRMLCTKGADYPENYQEIERQINILLSEYEMKGRILPIKSVGVQGDARTYRHPLVLCGDTDWEQLEKLSTELTNRFTEINRVIYLLGGDIDMIEVMPGFLTPKRVEHLQQADAIVMGAIAGQEVAEEIWQFPTVLIPVAINGKGKESVVLRPVSSSDAMTANFTKIDWKLIHEMKKKIEKDEYISAVFYDVTNKPPATIEWE